MRARRRRPWLIYLAVFVVLFANSSLQRWIWAQSSYRFDDRRNVPAAYQTGQFSNFFVALAAFRNIAANLLWTKTDEYWHDGRWYRILPIMDAIVRLDPQFLIVWETYAWHCAYNLNTVAPTRAMKVYWLKRGLNVLERGIRENPKRWTLYGELGYLNYDRVGDWDEAARWFKCAYETFNDYPELNQDFHPQKVIHSLAHIYEITWDIDQAKFWWQIARELNPSARVPQLWLGYWTDHADDIARKDELHTRERRKRAIRGMQPFVPRIEETPGQSCTPTLLPTDPALHTR